MNASFCDNNLKPYRFVEQFRKLLARYNNYCILNLVKYDENNIIVSVV